jgi:hypothetical protein
MFTQILSLKIEVKLGIVKNDNKKPTSIERWEIAMKKK